MKCIHCGGDLKRGAAPFHVDRAGYHVRWDAVPAWVCTQCGEPLFGEREVDAIQAALRTLDAQANELIAGASPSES